VCGSPNFFFYAAFGGAASSGCTATVTSGACAYYTGCSTTNPSGDSAGTLTISGGSLGMQAVLPGTGNIYQYTGASGVTEFTAGQTLTVTASGATVPAFGPESVTAPAMIGLTAPAATGGAYTISTASDLAVTWTGGQAGAQVLFEGVVGSGTSYFSCTWDAAPGSATVPHAVLTGLAGQSGAFLAYGQVTTTTFTAGAYTISLAALPYGGGNLTFQ
jgi:hypothetical protein